MRLNGFMLFREKVEFELSGRTGRMSWMKQSEEGIPGENNMQESRETRKSVSWSWGSGRQSWQSKVSGTEWSFITVVPESSLYLKDSLPYGVENRGGQQISE